MNPKQFLVWGGIILVLVAVLGFFGLIGPTPEDSIFGATWYFTPGENWAHLVLGVVALLAAGMLKGAGAQKNLVILVGVLGLFFGVYNLFSEMFLGAHLEQHADTALHFVVGIWALWAAMRKPKMMMAGM